MERSAFISITPFAVSWKIHSLSCESGFYLVYMVIGIALFLVYACMAKRYKHRMRDEPSHIHRYTEE